MPKTINFEFFLTGLTLPDQIEMKMCDVGKTKGKNKVFVAIFVLLMCMVLLPIYKYKNLSKIQKTKKVKRDLTTEYIDYQDDSSTKNDVQIVPENRETNVRYPNHRYPNDKPGESKMSPSRRSEPKRHFDNIQDVILKSKSTPQNGKFLNLGIMKGSGSSMRLKGVYKQAGRKQTPNGNQNGYSKEINSFFQNELRPGEKKFVRNSFRLRGSPFRLPAKGADNWKRQKPNLRQNQMLKHPITIYLDFYPMNRDDDKTKNFKSGSTSPEKNYSSLAAKESVNFEKFVPTEKRQNGIIMKLNLYPKGSPHPKGGFRTPTRSNYNERAERKSFGWFSKDKKEKHPKKCSFVGLNPLKNHITAKWKNEKGEWIHADYVNVKYLKKEND